MKESSSSRYVYRRPESEPASGGPRHRRQGIGGGGGTRGPGRLTRRRWPRRVLIGINVVVAVCIIGTASAYGYVEWRLNQIHREKLQHLTSTSSKGGSKSKGSGGPAFNLLIVGSDSRADLDDGQDFGGSSTVGGQRSDTIILARVVPSTGQIIILSIPRDLWVNIPGQGENRINSAFNTGADLLVQTIQDDLHIPINHYVEVNFDTFRDISNAVGGIGFYFPTPAKDAYSGLNIIQAGCYSLEGDSALDFVRSRHYEYYEDGYWQYEAESDLARIQRQQAFIKKLINKAEGEYTNPIAINNVIGGLVKNLTVDSGMSNNLILSLAEDFRHIDAGAIPSLTLPNYSYTTAGGADVLGLQEPQASQTIADFLSFGNQPVATPAPKKTAPTTSTTTPPITAPSVTVAPTSVNIEVANGTGVGGQAEQLSTQIANLGYHSQITYNSPGLGYAETQILYAPDSLTAAQQLAAQIPGGATLMASATLSPTPFNLEVVSGSSYSPTAPTGKLASTGSSTSSTVVGATTTTIPGLNSSNYVLPGLQPGQTVPNC